MGLFCSTLFISNAKFIQNILVLGWYRSFPHSPVITERMYGEGGIEERRRDRQWTARKQTKIEAETVKFFLKL